MEGGDEGSASWRGERGKKGKVEGGDEMKRKRRRVKGKQMRENKKGVKMEVRTRGGGEKDTRGEAK